MTKDKKSKKEIIEEIRTRVKLEEYGVENVKIFFKINFINLSFNILSYLGTKYRLSRHVRRLRRCVGFRKIQAELPY